MNEIFLIVVATLTSWFSGFTGMGGGILLLSAMTFFLQWDSMIPVHGLVQLTSNSSRALFLARYIHWPFFLPFLIGAPGGGLLGYFFIRSLPSPQLPLLLICLIIIYAIFKPKKMPPLLIPGWSFSLLGLVAGFLGLMVGATGPMLAPFFLREDLNRHNIIATKAACQIITHIIKVPVFLALGFAYSEHWVLILGLCVAAVVGTKLGVWTLGKLDEQWFRRLYKFALGLAAARLLYKVLG